MQLHVLSTDKDIMVVEAQNVDFQGQVFPFDDSSIKVIVDDNGGKGQRGHQVSLFVSSSIY